MVPASVGGWSLAASPMVPAAVPPAAVPPTAVAFLLCSILRKGFAPCSRYDSPPNNRSRPNSRLPPPWRQRLVGFRSNRLIGLHPTRSIPFRSNDLPLRPALAEFPATSCQSRTFPSTSSPIQMALGSLIVWLRRRGSIRTTRGSVSGPWRHRLPVIPKAPPWSRSWTAVAPSSRSSNTPLTCHLFRHRPMP